MGEKKRELHFSFEGNEVFDKILLPSCANAVYTHQTSIGRRRGLN